MKVLFFGAGASYGSDSEASHSNLPPLGEGLFDELLKNDRTLWKVAEPLFKNKNFEDAWRDFAYGLCRNDFAILRKYQ